MNTNKANNYLYVTKKIMFINSISLYFGCLTYYRQTRTKIISFNGEKGLRHFHLKKKKKKKKNIIVL